MNQKFNYAVVGVELRGLVIDFREVFILLVIIYP